MCCRENWIVVCLEFLLKVKVGNGLLMMSLFEAESYLEVLQLVTHHSFSQSDMMGPDPLFRASSVL